MTSVLMRFNVISYGCVYYGEALCGVSYKLYQSQFVISGYNTLYFYDYDAGLNIDTPFDFKAPKSTGIYYLGMKDDKGNIIFDDPNELKMKVDALKELVSECKNTDWQTLLTEELEKAKAELEKKSSKETAK